MASVDVNDIRGGNKVEIDKEPYVVVSAQFVKPGKGQAFTKAKVRHLLTGRILERNFRSGEKLDIADVEERKMRLLYTEQDDAIFMDDNTFDQINVPMDTIGDNAKWLKDDTLYDLVFYNGAVVDITPPTFMELVITQTDPGLRGDTASGRVMKPATLETGAQVQVPIFIEQDERIKVDTRTAEYVSRT